ncbi:autotransporter domain-containing protein [Rhodanobacter sp. 115]|uniref:autotransporter domain-containing protein n=1 Tax=Rhodanobacter sp. FW021-MT20 TaxID=1162282 RepID=UPI0034E3DA25
MNHPLQRHQTLSKAVATAIALSAALALSACSGGGGGGNVRPTPAPAGGGGGGGGGTSGGTTTPTYTYPQYSHLVPTGALAAQKAGFTGKGVTIGVLDSGVDESLAPLASNVVSFKSYITGGSQTPNDASGHGSTIEQVMTGAAAGGFVGGVAPGASMAVAQICDKSDNCLPYAQAYADLSNAGVKLYNQSWGAQLSSPSTFDIQGSTSLYGPMVAAGDLFVFAGGNSGANNLDYEAALPSYASSLQKGWLAVVNVQVDSNGNPTTLDSTSAACGVAEMWCLAAPGTVQTLGVPGTIFSSGLSDGTSAATAIVSGAAALVWQAYPWMSGTDVQQTLLTTATPLGGSGPNATFGWGIVNADKAVYGPAQFAFGEFDANVGTYNSTFANAISGSGSLSLTGTTGSLTLSGANTYTGGTTVNGPQLVLTGSLASDVSILGGTLWGTGTINGNVSNTGGEVSNLWGAAQGKGLTITGNYTAGVNATTAVPLGQPLKIGGKATLDGTLEIDAPASTYTPSSTETLLNYGSVSGTFASQTYGSNVFYQVSGLTYGATSLTANVTRAAVAQSIPLTAATVNVAQGLDSALNTADQWSSSPASAAAHSQFLGSAAQLLSARTMSQAITSVASLNGEIYGTSNAIEAQQSQVTDDAIALHQTLASNKQPGAWVQVLGSDGGLSQTSFASAKYTMGGALLGIDAPIYGNLSGGVAFGHTAMNATLAGLAGHTNGQANTFALYGKASFGNGAYLSGRASWTSDKMDVSRTALLGGSAQTITGNRTDDLYRGTLELGKNFATGQTTITPYLSVTGLRLDTDSFTENGAGGFGLSVARQSHTASFATLGARFGHGFTWSGGQSVLTGYLAWRRTLSGVNLGMTAAFVGAPGSDFNAIGQGLARNTGEIGATLSTQINGRWSWYINADAQAARGREHDVTANAGLTYRF